jgi:hypothetical protein
MEMHRIIFSLIDNLHDLVCRGNKDHKEALMKVQDYNMTKVLSRKCSVPDETGDIKLARCDFNILFCVQMDVELYNFCTILFHNYRNGKLENLYEKNKGKGGGKGKKGANQAKSKSEDIDTKGINAALSILTLADQPSGIIFERNNADFMNNFYIDITCRAFTNIEDIHKAAQENKELNQQNAALKELKELSVDWKGGIDRLVETQFNQYDTQIMQKHKQLET